VISLRSTIISIPAAGLLICSNLAPADEAAERGRLLLAQHCAQCHALGRTGESPLPSAPPFRRIGERMDMDELMVRMREGLSSGHRDMPMFRFSREDGRAIRSYLNLIQQ
jgi:mono/diheme cytochrome c family protein